MPKDLRKKISSANGVGQAAITAHLTPFTRGMYFVAPPLATRLPLLKEAIEKWQVGYSSIREEIEARWDSEIQPRLDEFNAKYDKKTRDLSKEAVVSKYDPKVTWMPFNPEELADILHDKDEIREMQREFQQKAEEAVRERTEVKLRDLEQAIGRALSQVDPDKGKPRKINKKTLTAIDNGVWELETILSGRSMKNSVEGLKNLHEAVFHVKQKRDKCDSVPGKQLDSALVDLMNATKRAKLAAMPLIAEVLEPSKERTPVIMDASDNQIAEMTTKKDNLDVFEACF